MSLKTFSLGALMSAISGTLASPFNEVHELIEHAAGGPVLTHELPAVSRALLPGLVEQFPALAALECPPEFSRDEAGMRHWTAQVSEVTGLPLQVAVSAVPVDLTPARNEAWGRLARRGVEAVVIVDGAQ